jgi:hypothetical protein
VFNGQITIKISTDGKILVIGQLNFAADNLSISSRLYADLSKIAAGEAKILLLTKVPDQINLLTIGGSLQFGFMDVLGNNVDFKMVQDQAALPTQGLAGPGIAAEIGFSAINNLRYIDVTLPDLGSNYVISPLSVTDEAAEIQIETGDVALDSLAAPTHLSGNTYRYWLTGTGSGDVTYSYLDQSWAYTNTDTYAEAFFASGDIDPSTDVAFENVPTATLVVGPYIDIRFIAELGGEVTAYTLIAYAATGQVPFQLSRKGDTDSDPDTPIAIRDGALYMGRDVIRYFVERDPLDVDQNTLEAGD